MDGPGSACVDCGGLGRKRCFLDTLAVRFRSAPAIRRGPTSSYCTLQGALLCVRYGFRGIAEPPGMSDV